MGHYCAIHTISVGRHRNILDGMGLLANQWTVASALGIKDWGPRSQALLWAVDVAVFLWIVHGARHMRVTPVANPRQSFGHGSLWIGGVP